MRIPKISFLLCAFALVANAVGQVEVSKEVTFWLQSQERGPKKLIVLFRNNAVESLPSLSRNATNHATIIRRMKTSQAQSLNNLQRDLTGSGFSAVPEQILVDLWLVGGMIIEADQAFASELVRHPLVARVQFPATKTVLGRQDTAQEGEDGTFTYGLTKIGVPAARERFPQYDGRGVRVGVIDTGVDAEHPELKGKVVRFRDFVGNRQKPYDDYGHGTHVSGTIAGGYAGAPTAIGVAPYATLTVAKVFGSDGNGDDTDIIQAMQWMADPDGNPDTEDDVPHVVNNSWGGSGEASDDSPFYKAVAAWRKLEIYPSFAAGNSGPSPKSIGLPGGYRIVTAVGATDSADNIASFSSRGPSVILERGKEESILKPDVSAPGVRIYSALPDGKYASWSGTSMATPHLTGVVAILKEAFPTYTIDEIDALLKKYCDDLGPIGADDTFGAGRINLLNALMNQSSGDDGEKPPGRPGNRPPLR